MPEADTDAVHDDHDHDHAHDDHAHEDHDHSEAESVEAKVEEHGAHEGEDHEDHGHHYSFVGALAHHSLPYPAWEVFHGHPLLIFNSPKYAAKKYEDLKKGKAEPTEGQVKWAESYLDSHPEIALSAPQLAKAMAVSDSKAYLGTFPQALSWVNHMSFFGTIALLITAFVLCVWGRRKADELKPKNKIQHALEAVTMYIRNEVVRPNIHHGDAWTAHFTAIFFAILAFNLFGLIPGGGAASAHLPITAGFAITTLLTMLIFGMKEQGVGTYFKTLNPVPFSAKPLDFAIWLILMIIELMGLIIKPTALAVRLFANMFAGHTVILTFTSLFFILYFANAGTGLAVGMGAFGWVLAVCIFILKLLVAFIQAFVFTLLSAVFVGASVHPEH